MHQFCPVLWLHALRREWDAGVHLSASGCFLCHDRGLLRGHDLRWWHLPFRFELQATGRSYVYFFAGVLRVVVVFDRSQHRSAAVLHTGWCSVSVVERMLWDHELCQWPVPVPDPW